VDSSRNALGELIDQIVEDKRFHRVRSLNLITDEHGVRLSQDGLRWRFDRARKGAADQAEAEGNLELAAAIRRFQFRDLRAKAGTDKAERAGVHAAQKQLGRGSVTTTEVYVRARRGQKVEPTK
jgi:integrase